MSCGPVVQRRGVATRSRAVVSGASLLAALLGLFSTAACEGCEEPPPSSGVATLLITTTGRQLPADGVSVVEVTVRGYTADDAADNSAVTVNVDGGALLSDVHTVAENNQQLTGTPEAGVMTFQFRCQALNYDTVTFTAQNADASATSTISCVEPDGSVSVTVDLAGCATLLADGQSFCTVPVQVQLIPSNPEAAPVGQENLPLTVAVESATLTNPAQGEDPTFTNLSFLTRDVDAQQPQDEITVTTDVDGVASFRVFSTPATLNKPMSVRLRISGTATTGEPIDQNADITLGAFVNGATLSVTATPQQIGSDLTSELSIVATNHRGAAPEDEGNHPAIVTLSVPSESGVVLRSGGVDSEGGLLDVSIVGGTATVEFDAPPVTAVTRVPVNVSYQSHPSLPVIADTAEVRIFPDNSIILNVQASPTTIQSDDNTTSTITAHVTEFNAGSVVDVSGATVRFSVGALHRNRIGIGNRAADEDPPTDSATFLLSSDETTDSIGIATAVVSSRNERVRGNAEVNVEVVDNDVVVAEGLVTLLLEREPILQSIVFVSATPSTIGVRGGAYTSSSVLTFQVFDDLAQPLPNVAMTFDLNATSDPEAFAVPQGTTDGDGRVSTTLSAGTQAGPISVVATALFNGRQMTVESLPVAVTGGLPSFANSYIQCAPGSQAQLAHTALSCTVHLVDRFTNRAPPGLAVQFRAEGGNIQPAVFTGDEGSATATFTQGEPGSASASLLTTLGDSWSYGAALPNSASDLVSDEATRWNATAQIGCFDANPYTSCSVFDLCFEAEANVGLANNLVYCPLLTDPIDDVGCWNKLEAGAITGDAAHLSDALLLDIGLTRPAAQILLDTGMTAQNYFINEGPTGDQVRAIVDAHLDNMFRCGAPTACITGNPGGLSFVEGDECLVNAGCMDFNKSTTCPQDGLLTITAIARGEESFTDLNGNGILDFTDINGNGRHDPGEPIIEHGATEPNDFHDVVVDMPEPFLDKDDNCFADDFTGSLRLLTLDAIRRNDLYSDEDGSGSYGYTLTDPATNVPYPEPLLTNQQWDRDKEIFFSDHALVISGAPGIKIGVPCDGQVGQDVLCSYDSQTYLCESAGAGGAGVLVGCQPNLAAPPATETTSVELRYKWVDANDNCYSPGFANRAFVFDDSYYNYDDFDLTTDNEMGDVPLTSAVCGVVEFTTPRREWCSALPFLGATYISQPGRTTCLPFEAGKIVSRTIAFTLTQAAEGFTDNIARHDVSYRLDCTAPAP